MIGGARVGPRQVLVIFFRLACSAREMLAGDKATHGTGGADLMADLDRIDGAVEIIGLGEGIGIDDRRIDGIAAAKRDAAARAGPQMVGIEVAPLPPGTAPTPSSTPAPARKWNCRSGVFSLRSLHQKAPPSTMLEATGPDRYRRYCTPAKACQWSFLYLS